MANKKYYPIINSFFIIVSMVLIFDLGILQAQHAGGSRDGSADTESTQFKRSGFTTPFLDMGDSTFNTTVFTFNDITIFSYFNDTEVSIMNAAGDTLETKVLARDEIFNQSVGEGIYSISGSKSYTALIGDALTSAVQGYFATDQSGRGTSTLLNTYMMREEWGPEKFILFAYNNNTRFTIKNLETGDVLYSGLLDRGEHFEAPQTPYNKFLQVTASKPVSALSYGDQDYYVPADNGRFSGTQFFGYSANIGNWTNSITITSYHDDNSVIALNSTTGDTLVSDTLNQGQVITHPVNDPTYWEVTSTKTVTTANIPYAGWGGSYLYMTRAMDETGVGSGRLFYVPAISSSIDVFSFADNNDIEIVHLGENTDYPYDPASLDTVFNGQLNESESFNFTSLPGNHVYKITGSSDISVLQSNGGFGADFMPLSFAQELPDLAISEDGLSFNPPDNLFESGERVEATITVKNFGPLPAENVSVELYDGDVTSSGTAPVIGSRTIPFIDGQDSASVSTEFVVPENPDFRTLSLRVDPNNQIQESNSSNNTIVRSLTPNNDLLPPLPTTITAPSGLEIVDDELTPNPFTVKADIFNEGDVAAENILVELKLFDGLELIEGDSIREINSLASDQSITLEWSVAANVDSSGVNRYTIMVDADNAEAKTVRRSVTVPDEIPPPGPENLVAQPSGDNDQHIMLSWAPSPAPDLAGYNIYYGSISGNYNGTMADQGPSPISISTFSEFEITGLPGDNSQYFFAIRAFDNANNLSPFSNEAERTIITAIDEQNSVPEDFTLSQNFPNPFNPTTTIQYALPEASKVKITLYDMLGQQVSVLVNARKVAGNHSISLNMGEFSSGMYIYNMKAGNRTIFKTLTLIK